MIKTTLLLLAVAAAGCGDNKMIEVVMPDLSVVQPNPDLAASYDMTMSVMRGPTALPLPFEPSGLFWDAPTQTLYLTSSASQIIKWTDGGTLSVVADLQPFAPATGSLGQVVRLTDGSLIVPVFGGGTTGGVLQAKSDGTVVQILNLDAKRRRIGVAVASDGTLYDDWFVGTSMMVTGAGVSKLALDGSGETDLVTTGLLKPVGLVVSGGQLIVSDQKVNAILQTPVATPGTLTALAPAIAAPDLMTVGPNGDLFAGGPGVVYRVKNDGTVTNFVSNLMPTRGQAYDADHKRLFFAEPDAKYDADAGTGALLHIVPVDN
jgi:hypothetical protein